MFEIYWKEIRELLRDRKTLIFTILVPIFALPLLFGGGAWLAIELYKSAANDEVRYAVVGASHAPALVEILGHQKNMLRVDLGPDEDISKAIAEKKIKIGLVIPAGFNETLDHHAPAKLEFHYNGASSEGSVIRSRMQAPIESYNEQLRQQALPALMLSKQQLAFVSHPITIEEHSTADMRATIGAAVGGLLPYFLMIVCLTAAMYPAIDLAAGEKERGTLETLLLAPVPLRDLVLAKFLVLFSSGMTSALLLVTTLGLLLAVFGAAVDETLGALVGSLGFFDFAMLAVMMAPVAAIFAAILLSISVYARSFKEASGMMQPLMVVLLLPIMLAMVPGVELNWLWAAVPLTNVSLAMKELIKGTLQPQYFAMIFLSSSLVAGGLLVLCQWWFSREEVLFRD